MLQHHFETLRTAHKCEAVSTILDTLICIAEESIADGETERAAEILALVQFYPLNKYSKIRAETLYLDLKAEICPRVILDAESRAREITLDELVNGILNTVF
jgi:hypothetical protein